MSSIHRLAVFVLTLALTVFGAVSAQEGNQNQDQNQQQTEQTQDQQQNQQMQQTQTVGGQEFVPYGTMQVSQGEAYDGEGGAIIFTAVTPDDQHPNVDLVGPNDYYNHFEFGDNPDEEFMVEGLAPGVYSVAATDDGLDLVHALVEVTEGQAVRVHIELQPAANFAAGTYSPGAYPTYPTGTFTYGQATPYENPDFGQVAVETDDENARFVMTGPNNYFQEFSGNFSADDLMPGIYVIAGTAPDSQVATTKIEVQAAQAMTVMPALVVVQPEGAQDVAGGGEGQQQDQQQDQQNQEGEQQEGEQQEGEQQQ